jgi:hypothetical protein
MKIVGHRNRSMKNQNVENWENCQWPRYVTVITDNVVVQVSVAENKLPVKFVEKSKNCRFVAMVSGDRDYIY